MHQDIPSDISQWDDQDLRAFIKENAAVFRAFASKYVHDQNLLFVLNRLSLTFYTPIPVILTEAQ